MNELPHNQGVSNLSDQYRTLADPRDLAALVMIESQDLIFAAFEDGIKTRTQEIQAINSARSALIIAISYAQEAEQKAQDRGKQMSDDEVVVIEAEDAVRLHQGVTATDLTQADAILDDRAHAQVEGIEHNREIAEPNALQQVEQEKAYTAPPSEEAEKTDEIMGTYEEGEVWELTIMDLKFLSDMLLDFIKVLGQELTVVANNAIKFLEESEETIKTINETLRKTEIDPSLLDTLSDENCHFEMSDFLRKIDETRLLEKPNTNAERKGC